jgi:peroxiredoxin
MLRKRLSLIIALLSLFSAAVAASAARVGDPAPNFNATDSQGKTQNLAEYRGKYVVLEWTNNGCPYTRKHYESGNMQSLQKEWTNKGVVWLSVLSSAPGEQGYMTAAQENQYVAREHASPTAVLLDPKGSIGHEYDAKTTPHMFVIDPSGKLIYEGAIDDHATPDPSDIKSSKNYVSDALSEAMAGKQVSTSHTRPYGCSIKYAD